MFVSVEPIPQLQDYRNMTRIGVPRSFIHLQDEIDHLQLIK